jgi:O-antigen ligase
MLFSVKNFFLFKYLFILFPFLLISGPFLSDTFVTLFAIYFVIYSYLKKNFFFLRKNLIIFFLIFYFYINFNSIFSHNPFVSFSTSVPYVRLILFSFFTAYLFEKITNLKRIIFFSFLFSYLILFFDSITQLILGQNILGYPIVNNRIASFFRDKLVMGSYVSKTLPILIAISYLENFKKANIIRFFLILISFILIFFSAERVSMFYFFITFLLYLFLLPNKKQVLLNIVVLGISFFLLFFIKPSTVDRVYKHTLFQFNEKKISLFSERHEMHFVTAYRMFLEKKYLGHGIKSFRYICDKEPYSTRDLIEKNNRNYSPIDGYYYLKKNFVDNRTFVYYVLEKNKLDFEKKSKDLEIALISKDASEIQKAENLFSLFEINNLIISIEIKNKILDTIKSSSKVGKGDYVFSNNEFENGCNTHPHSFHLQILSEIGLFGYVFLFIFFIYLLLIFLKDFIKIFFSREKIENQNYNSYKLFIILALIEYLFPLIPSGNFFNNWLSVIFYFNLAFLLNFYHYNKKY